MKAFVFLFLAIVLETAATTLLKMSDQFSKIIPTVLMVAAYVASFYFLSLSFKSIPVGIAYAIWGGVGIILISLIGIFLFKQTPDLPAIVGLTMIVGGVVVINVFSKLVAH